MKKIVISNLFFIITLSNCFSQIKFEKGYFIDSSGQRTECLIKNTDWGINPLNFEYKLSEEAETQQASIIHVKEFAIYNNAKYIRAMVEMDRSANVTERLSTERNPVFKEELLFLKVLIEGGATLYQYNEIGLNRYFYSKIGSEIKQLVYKQYFVNKSSIATNELFKQQLYTDLNCPDISTKEFESLQYDYRDLEKIFIKYNKCINSEYIKYNPEKKKRLLKFNIRPGLNSNSLELGQIEPAIIDFGIHKFPTKINFRLGIETEFILPFNANKWSILVEPLYRQLIIEDTWKTNLVNEGELIATVTYKSLDIPIGLRHYFYLNGNSKVFVNFSYIFSFPIGNPTFELTRTNGESYNIKELKSDNNMAFGAGYKIKDKYSLEIRYETNRQLLNHYYLWGSVYRTFSVILGYKIF